MKALDIKLLRELWRSRGQAFAIALVLASGVATYILARSTIDSLLYTQQDFYAASNFADIFITVKRAPQALAERIREIPGVAKADTRVMAPVNLDISGFADPVAGLMLSLPEGPDALNKLYLRAGRLPSADEDNAVVINDTFAAAHRLRPGATIRAVINGRSRNFRITGIALSAEYVYLIRPGDFLPDYKRYGILWMNRKPLATAYGMDGAFNNVLVSLGKTQEEQSVIARLDALLDRWGGTGAIGRADQTSHHYLSEEIKQLEAQAAVIPIVFLGVAAFLLNVVVTRLIRQQREQIAILKAFGYSTRALASHYLKFVGLIILIGSIIGVIAGAWLGKGLSDLYSEYFRYPYLHYVLRYPLILTAVGIGAIAGFAGTLNALIRAVSTAPAQAMRPQTPVMFHETFLERTGIKYLLSQPARMFIRHIARHPVKSGLTMLGLALACAILTVGNFMEDSVSFMIDTQFRRSYRADLTLTFTDPLSSRVIPELRHMPGVTYVEPVRVVPARLIHGYRSYRTGLQGILPNSRLLTPLDVRLQPIQVPSSGLLLSDRLAKRLGVEPGDTVAVQVLDGRKPRMKLPVTAIAREFTGMNAYTRLALLNHALDDGDAFTGAFIQVEPTAEASLYRRLKQTPHAAGIMIREVAIRSFEETMAENILIIALVNLTLAGIIAVGVVYNSVRIALSERAFELATLRVLGLTRGEIAYILLGETTLLTLVSIPVGFVLGYAFCAYLAIRLASDLYRVPVVLVPSSYALAAMVILAATAVSSLFVYYRLGKLDLIGVLKTRE